MAALLAAGGCVSSKKASPESGGYEFHPFRFPPPEFDLPVTKLVAPAGTTLNLPEFLNSEAFFPANATRTYDSGEAPVPAGETKIYREFPALDPCLSPDGNWRWRFITEHESTLRPLQKVLRLETVAGERQMEFMFIAPTIGILWAGENRLSVINSWEDERIQRVDVVDSARRSTFRVLMVRPPLNTFFSYDELDGYWSLKARAWKNGSVLVVRGFKTGATAQDKLCAVEFSIDVLSPKRDDSVRLLRAFVIEP